MSLYLKEQARLVAAVEFRVPSGVYDGDGHHHGFFCSRGWRPERGIQGGKGSYVLGMPGAKRGTLQEEYIPLYIRKVKIPQSSPL